MPEPLLIRFAEGLRALREHFGPTVSVGTAFSGCDVTLLALQRLQAFMNERWQVGIEFAHQWCCEVDPKKQELLKAYIKPPLLFENFEHMAEHCAHDTLSGRQQIVPFCTALLAGFPCQPKSTLSRSRGELSTCIHEGTGKSGRGFHAVTHFVDACVPNIVILENVPNVAQSDKDMYARQECINRGYWVHQLEFRARKYGSVASRPARADMLELAV